MRVEEIYNIECKDQKKNYKEDKVNKMKKKVIGQINIMELEEK